MIGEADRKKEGGMNKGRKEGTEMSDGTARFVFIWLDQIKQPSVS